MADIKKSYDYINQYQKNNYDRITLLRKKGDKDRLSEIARSRGFDKTSAFINFCIDKEVKRIEKLEINKTIK